MKQKHCNIKEIEKDLEFSKRFKKKMNRIFREVVQAENSIPYPEIDTVWERLRGRFIVKMKKAITFFKRS